MSTKHKTIVAIVLIGFLAGAYFFGKWNAGKSDSEVLLEERVRVAEHNDSVKTAVYTKMTDSLTTENESLQKQNNQINAIKQLIRNEIKNTSNRIDALRDSDVQRYVDSIRATSGFN